MVKALLLLKTKDISDYVKGSIVEILPQKEAYLEILRSDKRASVRSLADYIEKEDQKLKNEIERVKGFYDFDKSYGRMVAGVDEVGRGPLAGPIVAAAVVLDPDTDLSDLILGINDSKKLSRKKREELDLIIREKALSFAIYEMSNLDIDRLGISYCNHEVFRGSLRQLTVTPEVVLSDGYQVKYYRGRNIAVIKGDTRSAAIACASIIAKVHRDRLMENLAKFYPGYGFEGNVGYGSQEHIDALRLHGATPVHRMSFLTNILSGRE
ncbi:MAG TPA: ribonuclease HII [Clostridiaceae bacterium]|nr:ribonuclease HII [Clostridiaceae bacterium]